MDITKVLESMARSIIQATKKMIDNADYDRSSAGRIVGIDGHNYTVEAFGGRYVVYCPQLLTLNQSVVVTAPQNNFNKLFISPDAPYDILTDIGVVADLTTTAKTIVPAVNELKTLANTKLGMYYSSRAQSNASIHYQNATLSFTTSEQTTHVEFIAPFASTCWGVFTQIRSGFTTVNPHISIANKTATGCDFVYSANAAFQVVVDFIAIGI